MEISEEMSGEHYHLLRQQHGGPNPDMRPVNYLEGVAFLAGIMIFMANITKEWDAAIIGFGALGIFILVKILGAVLIRKTFMLWQKEAKIPNPGTAIWRLGDDALYFTGSEFDAVLPYNRMREITREEAGAFVMLSAENGFPLPMNGQPQEKHYDAFFTKLADLIAAAKTQG